MSDIDPIDLYDTAEDLCLDVGAQGDDTEDLDQYRDELRGEVTVLESGGFESVGGGFAGWVEPQGCSEGPTPGAKALLAYLLDRFPHSRSMGIYYCRPSAANAKKWSEHAEGRAVDLGIPKSNSGKARPELGDPVVELLKPRAKELGIELLIYNRQAWSARTPGGRDYLKGPPHYDHVHIGMTPDAAARLNYATVEAILGGGGGGATGATGTARSAPALKGATHRVTASSGLNVRSKPTTVGSVVTKLPNGTQVAAQSDPPHDSDGYTWVKIKAVHSGRTVEGWVADSYLDPVKEKPAATARTEAAATDGATHRVVADSGLNMRTKPTTSGDVVVKLANGTEVAALDDPSQSADGYDWIKIRATAGGRAQEGWVASKYLTATS